MTIRHLKIFVCVYEERGITAAAKKMYLAQPAVSQVIKEIEQYYTAPLFDRISKKLYPTAYGDKLYRYATEILSLYCEMEQAMQNLENKDIYIGTSITIGSHMLSEYIKKSEALYPDYKLHIQINSSDRIESMLLDNALDFGLIEGQVHSQLIQSEKFAMDIMLFLHMLQLSACTFGGGYVIVSLMRARFVHKLHWLTEKELLDYTAIAQAAPGAVAVNASILVGYRVGGAFGVFVSVLGTVLPPLVLLSALSYGYAAVQSNQIIQWLLKGMQAGIVAIVSDVTVTLALPYLKNKNYRMLLVMLLTFILVAFLEVNVVFVILGGLLLGLVSTLIRNKRNGHN